MLEQGENEPEKRKVSLLVSFRRSSGKYGEAAADDNRKKHGQEF